VSRKKCNSVRIVGGAWRGRLIRFPDAPDLRPTPDRVRETLFNWLGQSLWGKSCLDLFAGSGALGFEALSRGAARVVMVESNRTCCRALEDNAARLGLPSDPAARRGPPEEDDVDRHQPSLSIVCGDALEFSARTPLRFDVIFLDPPFRRGVPQDTWARLPGLLHRGGLVYLEAESAFAAGPPFAVLKHGRAGTVHYHLIGRTEQ